MRNWSIGRAMYTLYEAGLRRRKTLAYLADYDRQQWCSRQEVLAIQWEKLKRLLSYCEQNVPYYRRRWRELGIAVADVRSMADFERFPAVSKDDIREHYDEFVAEPLRGTNLRKTTGGSTGRPFAFEYTRESYERRTAVMLRGYGWAGMHLGAKTLYIWGTDLGVPSLAKRVKSDLYNGMLSRKFLNCFDMREGNLEQYALGVESYRPEVVVGYTSALEILARYLVSRRPLGWKPKAVITAAEMLDASQRALIEKAFGAPVFHTYGCREFMLIGAECECHGGYHLSADHLLAEVVDESKRPIASGAGDLLVTDLHNYGMPFVRYANGDVANALMGECRCGRGLPLLGSVEGRRLDILRTVDGRMIPGEFFPHLMKEVSAIEEFQVRQTMLDRFQVSIVRRPGFVDGDVDFLRREIARVAGDAMIVEFQFVDAVPLTPTGKRRVTIYDVPGAQSN